jgi:PAS domain S-box-containing protein
MGQVQHSRVREDPQEQIRDLQERLAEAEETLHALRSGEVDAVIVSSDGGDRVYTLKGADETYRLFVQEMAEGAVTLTLDGLIVFSNEQFATMLGIPSERLTGARIQDFADGENAIVLSALLEHARAGSRKHELTLTTPGGTKIPVYMAVSLLQQEGIRCICAIVTNLTEHKRNEQIVAAEKLARSILEQAAEAILVADPNGRIIRASSGADLLAGTSTLLHSFDALFQIQTSDTGADYRFDQILAASLEKGMVKGLNATARTYAGKTVEVLVSAAPLSGPQSELLGCVITLTDITEAREASRLLEQAGRRFRRLVESNIVGMLVANEQGVVDANATFLNMLGYSHEDFVEGRIDWPSINPPEFLRPDLESMDLLRKTGAYPPMEKEFTRRDGTRIPVLMGGAVLSFEPQLEWISLVVDITTQRNVESELRRANADLEQFAFSASHDLQEPLRNVSIYSELLAKRFKGKLDGQALEFLSYLTSGARRMEMLIKDLLAYTQVANVETRCEALDANEALTASLLNLKNAVRGSGARVTSDPLPMVRVHKTHLQQVFQNLIGNALKYRSEKKPVVHVSAKRRDGQAIFLVRDNGIGIKPEYQEKIFGVFKRLHSDDEYAGTGIGLAICQRIVERYRGRIWVESKPGEGSTFYFSLPV